MSDRELAALARAAGLKVNWRDAAGAGQIVSPDSQRSILQALGFAANTDRQIAESRTALRTQEQAPLTVAQAGRHVDLALRGRSLELIGEDGARIACPTIDGGITAPKAIGYYRIDDRRQLAVTPRRAWSMRDVSPQKLWGVAAQVYSLRGSPGFGDFAALAQFCRHAAAAGAHAVPISPVHALFTADLSRYSPYGPSSRLFLNALYGAAPSSAQNDNSKLIDWPTAGARKLQALRGLYETSRTDARSQAELRRFVRDGGATLLAHARFELLDARFRQQGLFHWRDWPAAYRHPDSPQVRALKAGDPEIQFQLFMQANAARGVQAAQDSARATGMKIGLITDMAIGVDSAGSQAWSAQQEMLRDLSIGAPPDLFMSEGQNWGLTSFSPPGLRASGYAGFIQTLRAAMRHAGGIRLDHAMGLLRLWVVPNGASASAGAYLTYPMDDLLGLMALESQRHRAIVIAEDLGTVPPGFSQRIARAGFQGMRVLWFERTGDGQFLPPDQWDKTAAALSTTHDLPTIAGWWRGGDLAWRRKLMVDKDDAPVKARTVERRALWWALKKADCAKGTMPLPEDTTPVSDAAIRFLAKTECPLAIVPVEDLIDEAEQPNLPGTIDQHPNWRRRLKSSNPLTPPSAKRRVQDLNRYRQP